MRPTALKITMSSVCAAVAATHLLFPNIKIDAVTLGLLALGLLPWFQPLVKSLELPGGLKIELQDVKAATDKISYSVDTPANVRAEELSTQDVGSLSFIGKVAEQDPNLALVGLRIEIEKVLVELAEAAGMATERRGVGALLSELSRRGLIPDTAASGLIELIDLGNQAAHGATVSPNAAAWALTQAPQFLLVLSALRSQVAVPLILRGEIPKAEVLASFNSRSGIRIRFEKTFLRPPRLAVGFYGSSGDDLRSGQLQVKDLDKLGFSVSVLEMPESHSVISWSVEWKAIGEGK